MQLDCAMTLPFGLDDLEVRAPEPEALMGFLAEMEFRTVTKRIADKLGVQAPTIEAAFPASEMAAPEAVGFDPDAYECVSDAGALQVWINRIRACGYVAVDTETTGLNIFR